MFIPGDTHPMPELPFDKLHPHPYKNGNTSSKHRLDGMPAHAAERSQDRAAAPLAQELGQELAQQLAHTQASVPPEPPSPEHTAALAEAEQFPFAELIATSNYTFLTGASHPDELVQQAAELGYRAIAVADRNSVAGIVRAYSSARGCAPPNRIGHITATRIVPYWPSLPGHSTSRTHAATQLTPQPATPQPAAPQLADWSIVLLPTDLAGYSVICNLLTLGKRRAPKGECHLALHDIIEALQSESGRRIIAVFVCPNWHPEQPPDDNFIQLIANLSQSLHTPPAGPHHVLGQQAESRLYLAISCRFDGHDRARHLQLQALSRHTGIPLVATNDALYHHPSRQPLADVLTCIRLGTTISQAGLALQANSQRHLKPPAELYRLFAHVPDALANTVKIAERCNGFTLDQIKYEYPDEVVPPGRTAMAYLAELTWQGAHGRYAPHAPACINRSGPSHMLPPKVVAQLKHELTLIDELHYAHYFLTVHDIVVYARSQGILCQGRGAAANSAVCFCLGVTAVDPAHMNMLFERFISKERSEPPDIDIDFEHERREEVIQYLYAKYGRDRAALTAEVITYRGRSAVRDIGKALELSTDAIEAIAKNIDWWEPGVPQEHRLRELGLSVADRTIGHLLTLVEQLLGFPRHLSQHVGGFIITKRKLSDLVPIENARMADRTVVEWDKDDIEALGMLKVDVLALGMLTCISKALVALNDHGLLPSTLGEEVLPRRHGDAEEEKKLTTEDTENTQEEGKEGEEEEVGLPMLATPDCVLPRRHGDTEGKSGSTTENTEGTEEEGKEGEEEERKEEEVGLSALATRDCVLPRRHDDVEGERSLSTEVAAQARKSAGSPLVAQQRSPRRHAPAGSQPKSNHTEIQHKPSSPFPSPSPSSPSFHSSSVPRCLRGEKQEPQSASSDNSSSSSVPSVLSVVNPHYPSVAPCLRGEKQEPQGASPNQPSSSSVLSVSSVVNPPFPSVTPCLRGEKQEPQGASSDNPSSSSVLSVSSVVNNSSLAKPDLTAIPLGDSATFDMTCRADTVGVFQIESRAQMSMLPRLKPRTYYDLVIQVAIVRPGPIQGDMVHPYLRRRDGIEPVTYPNEKVREILARTLGVPLFQEQAMSLAIHCAGFSPGEADQLRRAIAAWKTKQKLIYHFGQKIITGMVERGYELSFAQRVFEQIKGFSEYGFPESHAASFAHLVYVSAWIKCHHPAHFAAALINSQPMGFYAPAQIIRDAQNHGVTILPIDVNFSSWDCVAQRPITAASASPSARSSPGAIRLGLRLISGLNQQHAIAIEQAVKTHGRFKTMHALWKASGVPISTLRKLAQADAFASMNLPRQQALFALAALSDDDLPLFALSNDASAHPAGQPLPLQTSAAAGLPAGHAPGHAIADHSGAEPAAPLPAIDPALQTVYDYASTGLSLKAHPVSFLRPQLKAKGFVPCGDLAEPHKLRQGARVAVAGVPLVRQRPHTANGVMFITIEDETSHANLILWPDVYQKHRAAARHGSLLLVKGTVQRQGQVVHVIVKSVATGEGMLSVSQLSRDFR